jgi:NAD(P)H-dependent FMN reductase
MRIVLVCVRQRSRHNPVVATLLLVSGSLRAASTNSAVLRTAQVVAPDGIDAVLYEGMGRLPHFNPDDDAEGASVHPAVAELRAAIAAADALLFCTPEYAGALPGSFKNLLEWTVGDAGTYNKRVGWINVSGPAAPTGAADAHDSLRKVMHYVHADVVEAACVRIPVARGDVGDDGLVGDPAIRRRIEATLRALAGEERAPARAFVQA